MTTTDRTAKLGRLSEVLARHNSQAILLTKPENLSWLLDGARVTVPWGGPSVLAAKVDCDGGIEIFALANEVDRMRFEELAPDLKVTSVPWYSDFPAHTGPALLDTDLVEDMRAARASLLPAELGRFRALGRDVATCATRVLSAAQPGMSERALAAQAARELVEIGAEPVVLLVAGRSRLGVPHPLPTIEPLGSRFMVAIGARRHGLMASLTRSVSWGAPEPGCASALLEVEADAVAATVPGRTLSEVFEDITRSYAIHGFGEDSWLAHHQGGPTGYLGRDPKVTPGASGVVHENQAFAWNPWAPGAKREDTFVVSASGPETLTVDPQWPTLTVRGLSRPATLELT